MAATLADLLAVPGLGIQVIAGTGDRPDALRRPVTWVAVSELADPTPYLEGGELVLLTGLGADLDDGAGGYVGRLVASGVAALGFGVGVVHERVPSALVAAADAAGLPLMEVDRPTPFVAVGKALADLLAAEGDRRAGRRLGAIRDLTARLADGAEASSVLGRLAHHVHGWAVLLDARSRVLTTAGHRPRTDVAARLAGQLRGRSGQVSAAEADGEGRVTVLPLGVRDRPVGFLAVGVDTGTDLDHHLVAFAASLLTLTTEQARDSRAVRRWARSAQLAVWTGRATPPAPAPVLGPLAAAGRPVRALVLPCALDTVLDALPDEDVAVGLPLPGDPDGCLLVIAEPDVDHVLGALGTGPGGLSDPVPAEAVTRAVEQARSLAARARDRVLVAGAAPPSLLDLLGPDAATAFAEAALAPVQALPDGAALIDSLTAYLVAGGGLAEAAEALGVHRHTLRTRLRRVAAVLGRDLDEMATRAELWVALSILRTV
jgi:purine catabolism regulator